MKPGNAVGPRKGAMPRWQKLLVSLGYGADHIIKFQSHWNHVVAAKLISGAPIAVDGIMGPWTEKALEAAFNYANSLPKDWMHYVHKAIQIGPQSKPKPTAGGGIASRRQTKSRRRMGR